MLVAATVATMALAGCGGRKVASVAENDSTITAVAPSISTNTVSENSSGIIAAQTIAPTAITPAVSGSTSTDSAATGTGTEAYTTAGVNFRKDADEDADVIGTIELGEKVEVLGTEDGWTQVRYDGETGYVKSDYIGKEPVQASQDDDNDDEDSGDYDRSNDDEDDRESEDSDDQEESYDEDDSSEKDTDEDDSEDTDQDNESEDEEE